MEKLLQNFIKNRINLNYNITNQWLIGFIEAEGHFAGKNKDSQPSFKISQHIADENLILAIKNYIGYGNIHKSIRQDGRSEAILTIYNKEILRNVIIPMCYNNFKSKKKFYQFNNWLINFFPDLNKIILNFYNQKINYNLNEQWLTGFVDGDGSFYVIIHKTKDYKFGYQIQAVFDIAQLDREQELLENISNQYFLNSHKWAKSKDTQHLRIMKLENLIKYVKPFFDRNNLQSRKQLDFIIWKEIISMMEKKEHLTQKGIERIKELRELQKFYRNNQIKKI